MDEDGHTLSPGLEKVSADRHDPDTCPREESVLTNPTHLTRVEWVRLPETLTHTPEERDRTYMMDADEPSKGWPSAPAPAPPGIYGAFPPPYYQQPANAFYPNTANIQYSANHPTQNSVHLAGQSLVVTTQPMMIVPRMQVQDYLGYSIFTMLCCFLPVGIAALVFSLQVRRTPGARCWQKDDFPVVES
ncbi:hypothetical protein NDU88_010751 [Pleurodeles waltl]|uniref:Uncharacterized protein n=1 Tax=Pleurodeles waltl TaxID=8319 RepID=A0AAV7Q133_PLEWA|nr:hypothetical protein NDU88_010751 [Pleurodeles waltl]